MGVGPLPQCSLDSFKRIQRLTLEPLFNVMLVGEIMEITFAVTVLFIQLRSQLELPA